MINIIKLSINIVNIMKIVFLLKYLNSWIWWIRGTLKRGLLGPLKRGSLGPPKRGLLGPLKGGSGDPPPGTPKLAKTLDLGIWDPKKGVCQPRFPKPGIKRYIVVFENDFFSCYGYPYPCRRIVDGFAIFWYFFEMSSFLTIFWVLGLLGQFGDPPWGPLLGPFWGSLRAPFGTLPGGPFWDPFGVPFEGSLRTPFEVPVKFPKMTKMPKMS